MALNPPYLLGLDIGTSGLKAVLVDLDGHAVGEALREYMPDTPRPGWAEQDPEVWLRAAVDAAAEVVGRAGVAAGDVVSIGFSGQMHSTVCLNAGLRPVRPAILWLDTRAAAQAESAPARFGAERLASWIGNPVMVGVTLASLLWLQENEPDTWARIQHVMLAKDYVRLRLTGELATDYSDASATDSFDVGGRTWCAGLLDAAGIPAGWLPPVIGAGDVAGRLRPDMAAAMGLKAGIPVACGAGDQEAQAVGNGIIRPGLLSCTIGTGGQLFAPIEDYRPDPGVRLHTFCHATPGQWHWLAATLTAGMSLRWLRDAVLEGRYGYAEIAGAAATVEPGAEGLIFLPYLAGERTPHLDPFARGVFYGLTLRHTWRHMARAVMEGVVLSLLDGLDVMRGLGGDIHQVVAAGGGARHPLWLQLQAAIFGVDIVTTESREASALGAALLGGVAAGQYPDVMAASERAARWSDTVIHPDPAEVARYREIGACYRSLYPALVGEFRKS
jgi:xylulokinase